MSGWSPHDKQPWAFGEPYTSYNRKWLQLKSRLTPYMYSLSFQAHLTGEPPVRAMQLEFPDEAWPNTDALSYQFMSGPFFLVAPVYENTLVRDNIMLPFGEWIDFTSGKRYNGPLLLNSYNCPLEDLPASWCQHFLVKTVCFLRTSWTNTPLIRIRCMFTNFNVLKFLRVDFIAFVLVIFANLMDLLTPLQCPQGIRSWWSNHSLVASCEFLWWKDCDTTHIGFVSFDPTWEIEF